MRRFLSIAGWIVLALANLPARAQGTTPAYDAVAIKPDKTGSGSSMFNTKNDTFQATNVSLKMLISQAYGIRGGLISGLPAWAESARFDINAKVIDYDPAAMKDLTREQRRAMIAAILTDRFRLKVHQQTRTLPVYELMVAKDGAKIKASPPPPAADPDHPAPAPGLGKMGRGGMGINGSDGGMELTANDVPLADFASLLSNQLDREVIDRTGLDGKFDLHMKWTSDNAHQPLADDAPPMLFTALQEQLGLKLEAGKGPVVTLVVDHMEQPTEN